MLYLHFQIKKKRKKNYVRKAIGIQQSKLSGFFFPLQCQRRRGKGPRKKKRDNREYYRTMQRRRQKKNRRGKSEHIHCLKTCYDLRGDKNERQGERKKKWNTLFQQQQRSQHTHTKKKLKHTHTHAHTK